MQQLSHSGQQICSVSRKPIQGQAENSSPEHRLSFKQQYYNCSGPKRWLLPERGEKKEKSIKWTRYSIRSSALDLRCTHLFPVLPGHTGTWQHQEEILTQLKAKRENQRDWKMWTSRPSVGQTHQSYLLHAHVGNRHRGHVLRFDPRFTAVLTLTQTWFLSTEICV